MQGNNELRLNQATMIEAVQKWVDESVPGQRVQSVKADSESRGRAGATGSGFVVSITAETNSNEED